MRKDSAGGKEAYEKLSIFIRGGKKNQIQMLMVAQPSHGSGQKQNKTKQHKKKKQKKHRQDWGCTVLAQPARHAESLGSSSALLK